MEREVKGHVEVSDLLIGERAPEPESCREGW